jgi:lipopolysaccharide export system protein LptA
MYRANALLPIVLTLLAGAVTALESDQDQPIELTAD